MHINPKTKGRLKIAIFIALLILIFTVLIVFKVNKSSNLENELVSSTYDMGYFKDINLENGLKAEITSTKIISSSVTGSLDFDPLSVSDNLFTIKLTGTKSDVENIDIHNSDRILKITKKEKDKFCLFCKKPELRIEINYIDNLDLERLVTTGTTSQSITP